MSGHKSNIETQQRSGLNFEYKIDITCQKRFDSSCKISLISDSPCLATKASSESIVLAQWNGSPPFFALPWFALSFN